MAQATFVRPTLASITTRYDRLARWYRFGEAAIVLPPGLRRKTVRRLGLKSGDTVLEVGCGTGRNLPLLHKAVGASGAVIGVDATRGMLERSQHLTARRGWQNVTLTLADAAEVALEDRVDAILFSLSYSVLPDRRAVVANVWPALRPGGRLVVMDAGLPRQPAVAVRAMVHATPDPNAHRHGSRLHSHPHTGSHRHLRLGLRRSGHHRPDHDHGEHGHSHGLIHHSIKRSRQGIRAVSLSLAVLALAAIAQTIVFIASGSIALLADVIHNFGDALTAVPLGIAFAVRSHVAERRAGLAVVAAIFISACVAAVEAVERLVHPSAPTHLAALALAGAIGYTGNFIAARIRLAAGRKLDSAALIADGHHARADAYVSLAVIASAIVVALGAPIADPIIGLAITLVILRITWQSWETVRSHHTHTSADAHSVVVARQLALALSRVLVT